MATEKRIKLFITITSILLFIYVSARAYYVSFTSDESYTYLHYVRGSWENLYHVTYTNNHLLNSWAMKWCSLLFGNSEFSLRLPNVLAYSLFLYYGAQLLFKLKDWRVILAGFLFLNLNPFVLDFFSLARGYGISMGLMMMSIYHLYSLFYFDRSVKNILLSLFPMCLAVLANLTMINLLLAIVSLMITVSLFPGLSPRVNGIIWKKNRWKIVMIPLIIILVFGWYEIPMLLQLQKVGNFDFGGNTGFWRDTVLSLVGNSFYGFHFWHSPSFDLHEIMVLCFFLIDLLIKFIIVVVLITYSFKKLYFLYANRSIRPEGFIWFLFMMLLFCFIAILIQHHFFHIPFSVDRAAIYFIPLFSCFFIFWVDSIGSRFSKKIWTGISIVIPLVLFIPSVNFNYCHWWRADAGINKIMDKLSSDIFPDQQRVVLVGVPSPFSSEFNYYRSLHDELPNLGPSIKDEVLKPGRFDYYLVNADGRSTYKGKELYFDPISELVLIRSTPISLVLKHYVKVDYEDSIAQKHNYVVLSKAAYQGEYIECTNAKNEFPLGIFDTILYPNDYSEHLIRYEVAIKRTDPEGEASLVISVERKGKTIMWREMNIREFVTEENSWTLTRFTTYLTNDIQVGDIVKCFFWNQSKYDIYVDRQTLNIYETNK